jgi:hypothetical protein
VYSMVWSYQFNVARPKVVVPFAREKVGASTLLNAIHVHLSSLVGPAAVPRTVTV